MMKWGRDMSAKTERFEMRFDQGAIERVDEWRDQQDGRLSRAEAVRRLVEAGLDVSGSGKVTLSYGEKLISLMFCELYKHLKIDGKIDPKIIESTIRGGHHWAFRWEYRNIFHEHLDNIDTVSEVLRVLEMWQLIEHGYGKLSKKDKARINAEAEPLGKKFVFPGFDGKIEREHLDIASFLINDLKRFSAFKGRGLNSHTPLLEVYRRMLPVYEPMMRNRMYGELNTTQIAKLLKAMIHPEHRKS